MGAFRKFLVLLVLAPAAQAYAAEPDRTRVLPAGQQMADSRTGKLRTGSVIGADFGWPVAISSSP